jgi:hypothetical protein
VAVVSALAGVVVLGLLVTDVFFTVFVPRGHPGPLTRWVYRWVWQAWHQVCRRARGARRRRLLALCGPLLLPLTIAVWSIELVLGFALIYLPLADDVASSGDETVSRVVAALYLSGYSATTLGVGDVYAQSTVVRLLSVVEAASGFALFSVAVTYLLSVYNALQRSTALALEVSRDLGTRDDALDVVVAMVDAGRSDDLDRWFGGVSSRLAETAQAQAQYPLLEYFHVPDDDRALPVALAEMLEVVTVTRALVAPERFPALADWPSARLAFDTASAHLHDRARMVAVGPQTADPVSDSDRRRRFLQAQRHLQDAGVPLRPHADAEQRYLAMRAQWDDAARLVLAHFGYERG